MFILIKRIFPALLLVVLILQACSMDPKEFNKEETFIGRFETSEVIGRMPSVKDLPEVERTPDYRVVVDKETGCNYIHYHYSDKVAISPYYDKDGKVKGCGEISEEGGVK